MTEVIPRLHIGNWRDAQANIGAIHVITVAIDSEVVGDEWFKLVDGPGNDVVDFKRAIEATVTAHRNSKTVLVHCHGGRSRSAAVVVGAMMVILGKNLCECYDLLISRHDAVRMHPYLARMLLMVEKK